MEESQPEKDSTAPPSKPSQKMDTDTPVATGDPNEEMKPPGDDQNFLYANNSKYLQNNDDFYPMKIYVIFNFQHSQKLEIKWLLCNES